MPGNDRNGRRMTGVGMVGSDAWRIHVTAAVVVEQDGRFLLVEERCGGRLVLNQPAGHLEEGETPVEAAIREAREETGWLVEPRALLAVQQWYRHERHDTYLRFLYEAVALERDASVALDAVIEDVLWLGPEAIQAASDRLRSPLVLDAIAAYRSARRYPLDSIHYF